MHTNTGTPRHPPGASVKAGDGVLVLVLVLLTAWERGRKRRFSDKGGRAIARTSRRQRNGPIPDVFMGLLRFRRRRRRQCGGLVVYGAKVLAVRLHPYLAHTDGAERCWHACTPA